MQQDSSSVCRESNHVPFSFPGHSPTLLPTLYSDLWAYLPVSDRAGYTRHWHQHLPRTGRHTQSPSFQPCRSPLFPGRSCHLPLSSGGWHHSGRQSQELGTERGEGERGRGGEGERGRGGKGERRRTTSLIIFFAAFEFMYSTFTCY